MTELSLRLLRLIADGDFHSGEALARALGVTRATIWNAVRALEGADLNLYKVRGRGYKLRERISMLDADEIARCAGACASRLKIEVAGAIESTNTLLMKRASGGAASGATIAAECQLGGRGRMGRAWHAGIGHSLTFSVLWRFAQGAAELAGLSLAAGIAVVRALKSLGVAQPQLKWPNDVTWREQKLAGILIEMHGDALGPSAVVIGIGLNVRLGAVLRRRIDQPAVDLESACGREIDRNLVLGALLANLVEVLDAFAKHGFAPLREEWQRYHAWQDRAIVVKRPTGSIETGIARGVAHDGALLVESAAGLTPLHSAEISIRATPGSETACDEQTQSSA